LAVVLCVIGVILLTITISVGWKEVFGLNDIGTELKGPQLIIQDNTSKIFSTSMLGYWDTQQCGAIYLCSASNEKNVLKVSTFSSANNTRSQIAGNSIDLHAGESIDISTKLELNNYSEGSHVTFEVYDSYNSWEPILQCPGPIEGPLNWTEFHCKYSVPNHTSLAIIRPVLNAGWSKMNGQEAIVRFGEIRIDLSTPISVGGKTMPEVRDSSLRVENYSTGHKFLTGIAFLGDDDFVVAEKNTGIVKRVKDGTSSNLLDLNVATGVERGLVGLAAAPISDSKQGMYIFVYVTENLNKDDIGSAESILGNRLYRYELLPNGSLGNQRLLADLPVFPGPFHNGGKILIGRNNTLYVTVGDLSVQDFESTNRKGGNPADGRAGILHLHFDGSPVSNILGNSYPLNAYFAYGIRNSFGLDIDPISGELWDSENGQSYGDEINLVYPGFNSGWNKVQGIWNVENETYRGKEELAPANLFDYGGRGAYKLPQLAWNGTIGITDLKFFNSTMFGPDYENHLLVADVGGRIYDLQLDSNRSSLIVSGKLSNRLVDTAGEMDEKILASNLGIISDLEIGPEGYLYVVSNSGKFSGPDDGSGSILRILPKD
jgi:glucose/arabinose dehydrogenase